MQTDDEDMLFGGGGPFPHTFPRLRAPKGLNFKIPLSTFLRSLRRIVMVVVLAVSFRGLWPHFAFCIIRRRAAADADWRSRGCLLRPRTNWEGICGISFVLLPPWLLLPSPLLNPDLPMPPPFFTVLHFSPSSVNSTFFVSASYVISCSLPPPSGTFPDI